MAEQCRHIGRHQGVSKRLKQAVSKPLVGACLASLLLLAACARPLTPNETAFAGAMFGDGLDASKVRVRTGIGIMPLPRPRPVEAAAAPRPVADIPDNFCTRTPQPRKIRWPAAFVLGNSVFFKGAYYAPDTMAGWPDSVMLPQFFIMSHELVHVWQGQNRDLTGYAPLKPLAEAARVEDPYYWDGQGDRPFLAYGFEQQAALLEDYLCFRLFEPTSPRLAELREIIAPVIPLDGLERSLSRP